ncbi:hypothetical protein BDW68DRAFT_66663 [Aspergillus falconensis]
MTPSSVLSSVLWTRRTSNVCSTPYFPSSIAHSQCQINYRHAVPEPHETATQRSHRAMALLNLISLRRSVVEVQARRAFSKGRSAGLDRPEQECSQVWEVSECQLLSCSAAHWTKQAAGKRPASDQQAMGLLAEHEPSSLTKVQRRLNDKS